jgi:hypothetical protein
VAPIGTATPTGDPQYADGWHRVGEVETMEIIADGALGDAPRTVPLTDADHNVIGEATVYPDGTATGTLRLP